MAKDFFTKTNCDRCGKFLSARIMSKFNEGARCLECKDLERKHPDYEKASKAELEAVKAGNYNFPGIGWPGDKKESQ